MEVRSLSDVTDFFFVCSADSDRGVRTIADNIEKKLRSLGEKQIDVEGYSEGNWVLVDSGDVIAHVFKNTFRGLYDLESLWSDAPRVKLSFRERTINQGADFQERYG